MSSPSLAQLKEALQSCLDEEKNVTDMTQAMEIITKLLTVPISREALEETRLGMLVNDVRKKNQSTWPQLGKLCRNLIKDWQKLVTPSAPSSSGVGRLGVSPGVERLATPSSRTTTPRQTATARLIAENGLRCSPSPAYTPKLQPTTPSMINGTRSEVSITTISPESSQRGPSCSSSYAPPEQSTTNGPIPVQSGLKLRIRKGVGDQQPSIVRETDAASSPKLQEHSQSPNEATITDQGAEEAANRRKRKAPPDQHGQTGLVNGGSKSVSPSTPVPSPATASIPSNTDPNSAFPNAAIKHSKKSKSTSPDVGSTQPVTNILHRPKLKSTAELVAEMTKTYPEAMSISLKNVVPTPSSPTTVNSKMGRSVSTSVMASVLAAEARASDGSDYDEDDSKDKDYVQPGTSKKSNKAMWTSTIIGDHNSEFRKMNKKEMLDRYLRDHSTGDSKHDKAARIKGNTILEEGDDGHLVPQTIRQPIDWYKSVQLPPLDLSVLDAADEEEVGETEGTVDKVVIMDEQAKMDSKLEHGKLLDANVIILDIDQEARSCSVENEEMMDGVKLRSRLLKPAIRGDREVLAMPYVDIGLPDFIEYGYTNRQQYLAHWSER